MGGGVGSIGFQFEDITYAENLSWTLIPFHEKVHIIIQVIIVLILF